MLTMGCSSVSFSENTGRKKKKRIGLVISSVIFSVVFLFSLKDNNRTAALHPSTSQRKAPDPKLPREKEKKKKEESVVPLKGKERFSW